jgi:glycosyltransferase involved in cell wall biosynthesis
MVRALADAGAEVLLLTLAGRGDQSLELWRSELPPRFCHRPLCTAEPNFLRRGEAFRDWVARHLVSFCPDVAHYRGLFEAEAVDTVRRDTLQTVFEVNGLFSVELGYHYPAVARAMEFQRKLRAREEHALERASLWITQSETTRAYLAGRAPLGPAECAVIPNGADPERYVPGTSRRTAETHLLYAGTLSPWQGVVELLMATRRIARVRPVRLTLAGPVRRSWQRPLERSIRRLGLADIVSILGPLERTELAKQVESSDICLAPLRKDARNATQGSSPIKLFEYMAAGRAVVTTDLPCVREIVVPDETGLVTASARPSALSAAVLRLIDDPALAARLGQAARESVTATATWAHRRAHLIRVYEGLTGSASSNVLPGGRVMR